jgi:hypothetical protein
MSPSWPSETGRAGRLICCRGCCRLLCGRPVEERAGAAGPDDVRGRIPADCRVISCTDLMIDESSLTGEAMPAEKTASILLFNETHEIPIAERTNVVFMVSPGGGRSWHRGKRDFQSWNHTITPFFDNGRYLWSGRGRWCAMGMARRWWWARG